MFVFVFVFVFVFDFCVSVCPVLVEIIGIVCVIGWLARSLSGIGLVISSIHRFDDGLKDTSMNGDEDGFVIEGWVVGDTESQPNFRWITDQVKIQLLIIKINLGFCWAYGEEAR